MIKGRVSRVSVSDADTGMTLVPANKTTPCLLLLSANRASALFLSLSLSLCLLSLCLVDVCRRCVCCEDEIPSPDGRRSREQGAEPLLRKKRRANSLRVTCHAECARDAVSVVSSLERRASAATFASRRVATTAAAVKAMACDPLALPCLRSYFPASN